MGQLFDHTWVFNDDEERWELWATERYAMGSPQRLLFYIGDTAMADPVWYEHIRNYIQEHHKTTVMPLDGANSTVVLGQTVS